MSPHAHHGHAHHDHAPHKPNELPLSIMAQSGLFRIGAVVVVLFGLWLAVLWAVSLP